MKLGGVLKIRFSISSLHLIRSGDQGKKTMRKFFSVALLAITLAICSALATPAHASNNVEVKLSWVVDPQNVPRVHVECWYHIDNNTGVPFNASIVSRILRSPLDSRQDPYGHSGPDISVPAGGCTGSFDYYSAGMSPTYEYFDRTYIYAGSLLSLTNNTTDTDVSWQDFLSNNSNYLDTVPFTSTGPVTPH